MLYERMAENESGQGKHAGVGETMNAKPKQVTLSDVLDSYKRNEPQAPSPLPAPITNNHLDKLADVYTSVATLAADFEKSKENPVIQKNITAGKGVDQIISKLKTILETIKGMDKDLDQLDVTN